MKMIKPVIAILAIIIILSVVVYTFYFNIESESENETQEIYTSFDLKANLPEGVYNLVSIPECGLECFQNNIIYNILSEFENYEIVYYDEERGNLNRFNSDLSRIELITFEEGEKYYIKTDEDFTIDLCSVENESEEHSTKTAKFANFLNIAPDDSAMFIGQWWDNGEDRCIKLYSSFHFIAGKTITAKKMMLYTERVGLDYGFTVAVYMVKEDVDWVFGEGTLVKEAWDPTFLPNSWKVIEFDTPFNLVEGETYTVEFLTSHSTDSLASKYLKLELDYRTDIDWRFHSATINDDGTRETQWTKQANPFVQFYDENWEGFKIY